MKEFKQKKFRMAQYITCAITIKKQLFSNQKRMQSPHQFPQIKHLRQFYCPEQLFSDAQELPQFFLTNLVDEARVVKYFQKDPQANIRIFYYQYLKLCFEIDNVDYESYIEKIYELIRTEGFEFFFDHNDPMRQHKNAQYKSLLIDFFEIMNSSSMTIDIVLTQYPILKEVFTNFFRTVVMIASITPDFDTYIDKNQLFDFLSSFFSVDISSYDKCLKFVESDIFVYEQNQENIYMAYIKDDEGEVQQSYQSISGEARLQRKEITTVKEDERESEVSNTTEDLQQSPTRNRVTDNNRTLSIDSLAVPYQRAPDNNQKPRAKTIIKQSYIQGQFADYTSFNNLSSFGRSLSGEVQREVLIECLQPNTTVNDNQLSEESSRQEQQHLRELYQKELKRVQSASNNVLLHAHIVDSVEVQDDSLNRETHNFFARVVSNPNLLSSENQTHKLAESHYDSAESKNQQTQFNLQSEQNDLQNSKTSRASGKSKTLKKNNMYVTFQEPTKDPGFANSNIDEFVTRPVESEMYNSHELTDFNQETLAMESKDSVQQKIQSKPIAKQIITKPYYEQPLFHKPSAQSPIFLSQLPHGRTISSSNSEKDQFIYNPTASPLSSGPTTPLTLQKFKLNVTKEFTNSIVMKSMTQPYKANVYQTRERARQFRKNIYKKFTYQSAYSKQEGSTNFLAKPFSKDNLASDSTIRNTFSLNNLLRGDSNYSKEKQQTQYTTPITLIKAGQKVDTEERISAKVQEQSKVSEVKESKTQLNKTPTNTGSTQQLNTSQTQNNTLIYQTPTQVQSKTLTNPPYQPIKSSTTKTTQPNPPYNQQNSPYNQPNPPYNQQNPPYNQQKSPYQQQNPPYNQHNSPYHQQTSRAPQTFYQPQYQPYNQSQHQPQHQPQLQAYVPYSSHNTQSITQQNSGRILNSQVETKSIPQLSLLSNMSQPQKPYPQYVPFERKK